MEKLIVQKVVVGGIIINQAKVLIIQRSADEEAYPNLWEVPSGKKEPLEKITDAILREVKEETGLDTEISCIVDAFSFVVEKTDETRDVTQINFLLKLNGNSDVMLSNEHQKFAWIKQEELNKYNISKETKSSIENAFLIK